MPRISGIAVVLDVFEMEGSLGMKIGALLIHATPALVMLALLWLNWRWCCKR